MKRVRAYQRVIRLPFLNASQSGECSEKFVGAQKWKENVLIDDSSIDSANDFSKAWKIGGAIFHNYITHLSSISMDELISTYISMD